MPTSTATPTRPSAKRRGAGIRRGEALGGWLFTAPMLVLLGLFLVVPILMALWVSFSGWKGHGSPIASTVPFVGLSNYSSVLGGQGIGGVMIQQDFGIALRNNLWYVILVVPIQTLLSLFLATMVNNRLLKGKSFFRVAYYFPSVTSSVAITVLWMFLFAGSGAINSVLGWLKIHGPDWYDNPQGLVQALLSVFGVHNGPPALVNHGFLGVSWWNWLSGPSWAMTAFILMAIFTTSGTFMLLFLAALQNLSVEVDEAALVDGANAWRHFWQVTVPQLKPTITTVVTLGLIGCWQVFDQIYTGTQGKPANTTTTPAYQAYVEAFNNQHWGQASAMAFILFVIIIAFTLLQRVILRDKPDMPRVKRPRPAKAVGKEARDGVTI